MCTSPTRPGPSRSAFTAPVCRTPKRLERHVHGSARRLPHAEQLWRTTDSEVCESSSPGSSARGRRTRPWWTPLPRVPAGGFRGPEGRRRDHVRPDVNRARGVCGARLSLVADRRGRRVALYLAGSHRGPLGDPPGRSTAAATPAPAAGRAATAPSAGRRRHAAAQHPAAVVAAARLPGHADRPGARLHPGARLRRRRGRGWARSSAGPVPRRRPATGPARRKAWQRNDASPDCRPDRARFAPRVR